jgi:hypothetical protein
MHLKTVSVIYVFFFRVTINFEFHLIGHCTEWITCKFTKKRRSLFFFVRARSRFVRIVYDHILSRSRRQHQSFIAFNYPNACRHWLRHTGVLRKRAFPFFYESTCGASISITIQRISCYKFTKPFQLKRTNLMLQTYRPYSENNQRPPPPSHPQPICPSSCFLQ